MDRYIGERDFEHGKAEKLGVLLCNLGTPDAPTAKSVRRYLAEFLSDPRVVELPRALWLIILHGIVLRVRPRRSAKAYAKVWTDEGSPLLANSKRQGAAIASALEEALPGRTEVIVAMRYGSPSIASGLQQLRQLNARKILILPLYPQYAAATTASVLDAVSSELSRWRWTPALRFISDYHADVGYIESLATSIQQYWSANSTGEHLLMSFHGTPKDSLFAGDPYHCQCHATSRLVIEQLKIADDRWSTCFQSRFGWNEWLQPYTEERLRELAKNGVKTVDVVCPGFSADCLETLEEIALRYAEVFTSAGGESLRYIPALNDDPNHIKALTHLIKKNLAGWAASEDSWDSQLDQQTRETAATHAAAMKNSAAP
jgi:ferrochelatase